ncbi:MAG: electron transfer flavoprotein-quinone oxidoreductase, partial [Thermodesulfobacteriota bacterium]|nr:electron transfer flavoprotein-quinone oxidoreductase [Thermodesulfobacteriota bacterium]
MEKFDVIIVGAGLAGLGAAYTLAGQGLEILVLERGDYPGAKNVTGGRIYVNPVRDLFPDLWAEAPLERFIVQEGAVLMAKERSVAIAYAGDELRQEPHQSYSVLRARFDRWFAEQVEARGAMILPKIQVENVIKEQGKIIGVRAGGDELHADVVIACDGVLSLLGEQAGLHPPESSHSYTLGIKEVISLEGEKINDRFQLQGNEGAARLFIGEVTQGMFGGGFLYTNKESLSLGIVIGIEDMMARSGKPAAPDFLEVFK